MKIGDRIQTLDGKNAGTIRHASRAGGTSYFVEWDDAYGPDRGGFPGTIETPLSIIPLGGERGDARPELEGLAEDA